MDAAFRLLPFLPKSQYHFRNPTGALYMGQRCTSNKDGYGNSLFATQLFLHSLPPGPYDWVTSHASVGDTPLSENMVILT